MYVLYDLVFLVGLLLYAPLYFLKAGKSRSKSFNLRARLGLGISARVSESPCLWFHAVSVGEVLSLRNLFLEIGKRHPNWEIHCSTLTKAGHRVATERLTNAASIFYAPLDFGRIVDRFFRALRPDLFILVESEFWPNLIRIAKKRAKAVLLINGRISEPSFRKYRWVKSLMGRVLHKIDRFLVQTEIDRSRLLQLDLAAEKIEVVGNLKCDVHLPVFPAEQKAELKHKLGLPQGNRVIVAGSTHRGEEEILLERFRWALQQRKNLSLILAPRHPERTEELKKLVRNSGLKVVGRTEAHPQATWDVLILDTIGELSDFYALADIAFIGGSLIPRGGQNLLEPAFYGKPIVFGPHMENFAFLAEQFIRQRAARLITQPEELTDFFLAEEEPTLREMGNRARELLVSLQGATQRTLFVIERLMGEPSSAEFSR